MHIRLVALLAALLVTPALAQIMEAQPIQRPVTPPAPGLVIQQDANAATKVTTIEEARAKIAQLNRDKRDLDAKLTEALVTIDAWTKKGGSLVHAYCENETLSQRSDGGGQEDCSASGYRCSAVQGTCRRSCNITDECAGGWVCHTGEHVCVHG